MMGISFTSCSDVLDETPRTTFTPEYFKTKAGVEGGITALYSNLRNVWGQGYFFNAMETGTDEYTYGESADENFLAMDYTDAAVLRTNNCRADALWGCSFSDINTANGVIEYGKAAGVSPELVAEANFFRALDYFELVQTFGGVPLDFGSGNLKFNTNPVRSSKRNTVPEVYQAIFADLRTAVDNLPTSPRKTGTVTQATARFFLAKAYLTFAWWLQNPKNIPTYPECERKDLDGHTASEYFQMAYDEAILAIKNPNQYKMQETYGDVFFCRNDRNSEIVLYADHTAQDAYFNGADNFGWGHAAAPDNFAYYMNRWNYCNFGACLQRTAYPSYARPWTRMAMPCEVPAKFTDQDKDYRFEGTFVTAFRVNWAVLGDKDKDSEWKNANDINIKEGDIALVVAGKNNPNVIYSDANPVCAGTLPGESYYILTPDHFNRKAYPNVWKNGYYNEKTYGDGTAGQPNGDNPRAAIVARWSEIYLIAAEAVVKGAKAQSDYGARDLINEVRARAGKWSLPKWANKDFDIKVGTYVADYSEEMKNATPAEGDIDINYILDERMREFYGEGIRWWDLVRTQEWTARATKYSIGHEKEKNGQMVKDYGSPVKNFTRVIEPYHYLRPIPQGQIDALQMTAEEKAAYQNPGYIK